MEKQKNQNIISGTGTSNTGNPRVREPEEKELSDHNSRVSGENVPLLQARQPVFSVIITSYNRSKLLKRALNSLIGQTEKDWEAIVVDDGSTDDTYEQVQQYLKLCPSGLIYLRQKHTGEAAAKNAGAWAARGKYITFLDSDDEYNPVHLEHRKSVISQNPNLKFMYGGTKIIGNQFVPDRFDRSKQIDLNNCVIGGSFVIEHDLFISMNGFRDIYLGTDADFFERAKETGIPMVRTSFPTYIYHHETEDSITNMILSDLNQKQ